MAKRVKGAVEVKVPSAKVQKKIAQHMDQVETVRQSTLQYAKDEMRWSEFVGKAEEGAKFNVDGSLCFVDPNEMGFDGSNWVPAYIHMSNPAQAMRHAEDWSESMPGSPAEIVYMLDESSIPVAEFDGSSWAFAGDEDTPFTKAAFESKLVEIGAVKSDEKLREDLGLDFDISYGKPLATLDDIQSQRYLRDAICRQSDASAGEKYDAQYPTSSLPKAIGRGLVTKQELAFIIGGIEESRKTGTYEIAHERVDKFHNVDVLVPGEGISRTRSSAADKRRELAEKERTLGETLVADGAVPLPGGGLYTAEEALEDVEEAREGKRQAEFSNKSKQMSM